MCGFSFLRHSRLYHLRLLFLDESGTGIGAANHLPLTSEPQKAVCTAEAEEECPYVSVRASRIGIYGHTSFVEFRLVHAFKRASKLEDVFFLMQFPHFGDVPFNLPLVTLTSILRLPDDASGGHSRSAAKVTPGFAGKARSSLLFYEKNLQPYG